MMRPVLIRIVVCASAVACGLLFIQRTDTSVESNAAAQIQIASNLAARKNASLHMLGVSRSGCDQCHYEEAEAWMKTAHYSSANKLLRFRGNTQKYANALHIAPEELITTSLCADCHGTKSIVNDRVEVISGVSCESCHGAAGGEESWLNRHQSYHPELPVTRKEETELHRLERQAACDAAGMVRPANIAGLTRKCLACHIISNEQLVAAGHKAFSAFEFNSWTSGELRHNFFLDRNRNQDAPTLWLERTGSSVAERKRLKYIVGTLVSLEVVLRERATLSNPTVISQLGGFAASLNGKLAQINAAGGTSETRAAEKLFTPMLVTIFSPHETDRETYWQAADILAELTSQFLKRNDVANMDSLDGVLSLTPPHYSQHFKDRVHP